MKKVTKIPVSTTNKSPKDSNTYIQIVKDPKNEGNVIIRVGETDYTVDANDFEALIEDVQDDCDW